MAVLHPTWHLTHTNRKESGGWSLSGTGCCAWAAGGLRDRDCDLVWTGQQPDRLQKRHATPPQVGQEVRQSSAAHFVWVCPCVPQLLLLLATCDWDDYWWSMRLTYLKVTCPSKGHSVNRSILKYSSYMLTGNQTWPVENPPRLDDLPIYITLW